MGDRIGTSQKKNAFINDENIRTNILSKVIQVTGKPISDMARVINLIMMTWNDHSVQPIPKLNSLAVERIIVVT